MTITKKYTKDWLGGKTRERLEAKLFAEGYKVVSEREVREWDVGRTCCLAIIFLPLLLFGKQSKIEVTYEKSDTLNT